MAKTGSIMSVAIPLLLAGTAAQAREAENNQGGASLAGTAVAAASPSRALPSAQRPTYVPGGWLCPLGFTWRNAGETDWLCVDAEEAQRIEQENSQASANWVESPDGARTCRSGLVEREAFRRDVVCVDPVRRDAIRQMNMALYSVR